MLSLMAATERQFSDFKSLKTEMKAALRQRRDNQKEAKKMNKKAYIYYMFPLQTTICVVLFVTSAMSHTGTASQLSYSIRIL